ncbi:hypothetical protein Scep_007918 [Stephania cephalantha]|uniref:Uncharacterized protein n=1 Tax=Stephania cephalantha TaxID=152367 RepID=A0AAP0KAS8_9MAGN
MGGMKKEKSSSTSTSPCAHLRSDYQRCFNRWYSEKFLKGEWEKEECVSEWDKYRACLAQHLKDDHLIRLLQPESHSDISVNDSQ